MTQTFNNPNIKAATKNTEKHKISKYLLEIIALIIGVISKIVIILINHKFQ